MKPIRLIGTGALLLFLGTAAPTYAQQDQGGKPEQHQQQAKSKKQPAARPGKQDQQQAKGQQKQQQHARTQQNQKPSPQHQQQQASRQQHAPAQGQWARNGQKDNRGHEYSESRFGPNHHARFEENGGRFYNGHREYSFGGYWFYADSWPGWFYQQDVYFVMGPDGQWYAVAYGDPSLTFQVYIQ